MTRAALIALALLAPLPAAATVPIPAEDMRAAEKSAEALTMTARTALTSAAYHAADKAKALSLIASAEVDANKALALSPNNIDASLIWAIATGYRAKLGKSPGLAKQARSMMEAATKRAPKNAMAWATLGGWHGELVATLGKFIAGTIIGAKSDVGIAAYERAISLDATSPAINTLYAISLVGMGKGDPVKLRALLTPVASGQGGDNFDVIMRERARALLAALDSGKKGALATAAAKSRAFSRIG